MNCGKARKFVLLRGSGELSRRKRGALLSHVEFCRSCSEYAGQIELMESCVSREPGWDEPGSDVMARVHSRARSEVRSRTADLWNLKAVGLAACAALLVIAAGLRTPGRARIPMVMEAENINLLLEAVSDDYAPSAGRRDAMAILTDRLLAMQEWANAEPLEEIFLIARPAVDSPTVPQ